VLDRYDPRDDARDGGRDLSRGGGADASRGRDREPVMSSRVDLDLPRGREREPVRDRDRVYDIDGSEARMQATVRSFRVVAEHDLAALRDDARKPQQSSDGVKRTVTLDVQYRMHPVLGAFVSATPTLSEGAARAAGSDGVERICLRSSSPCAASTSFAGAHKTCSRFSSTGAESRRSGSRQGLGGRTRERPSTNVCGRTVVFLGDDALLCELNRCSVADQTSLPAAILRGLLFRRLARCVAGRNGADARRRARK